MTTATTTRPCTRRPPCPTCGGPTHLWDRATGERVCVQCTGFRPADPNGPRPRPAGVSAAVRRPRLAPAA